MHAREDNPELIRAHELGLVIKSFPEFLYEQTKNKKRVVIGGSHGKTTITSMIMHVLHSSGIKFDYMVGSSIDGFETMVGLSEESEIAIFEGDEYLTSTIDKRPKFHLYNPDIAVISGIAWDHINVFPTFENYIEQFRIFLEKIMPSGTLIYCSDDEIVTKIVKKARKDIIQVPYTVHKHSKSNNGFTVSSKGKLYPLNIFGKHNMQNLNAAKEVCLSLGIEEKRFFEAISTFHGSARRLQLIREINNKAIFLDFAHAPSKVSATVSALAERYPDYKKVCCFELHTFSSLNPTFLEEYNGCLTDADIGYVFFNPHVVSLKRLQPLSVESVSKAFGYGLTGVFDNTSELFSAIKEIKSDRVVYLFMSSGDFNGTRFHDLAESLVPEKE